MVANYTTFLASTEQDIITELDSFLTNHVGWYREDTITDTASDRDYVWVSDGEPEVDNNNPRYIRIRGNSNNVLFYAYATYTDSSTYTKQVHDATNTTNSTTGGPFRGWFVADKERVIIWLMQTDTQTWFSQTYVGRFDSRYDSSTDPYPNVVKAGRFTTTHFEDSASSQYNYTLQGDTLRNTSHWVSSGDIEVAEAGSESPLIPGIYLQNTFIYNTTVGDEELRGKYRGTHLVYDWITPNGFYTTSSGVYVGMTGAATPTTGWIHGPLTDPRIGNSAVIPPASPSVDYTLRGFETDSDTLVNWRFDEEVGGVYVDQAGNYDLTPTSAPPLEDSPLVKALHFDGLSDYLSVAGSSTAQTALNSEWTVECVFKPDTLPGAAAVMGLVVYQALNELQSGNTLLSLYVRDGGKVRVLWEYSTGTNVIMDTVDDYIDVERWNYLAITKEFNGATYDVNFWHAGFGDKLPINIATFLGNTNSDGGSSVTWYVGGDAGSSARFDGSIDALRIQKKVLSASEIHASFRRVRL